MAQELTSSSSRATDRIKAAKAGLGGTVKPSRDDFRLKGPNKPAERRQGMVPLDPAGPPLANRRNRRVSLLEDEKDVEADEEAKAKMSEEVDEDPLLDVMEFIPEEYKKHHQDTEPMLHFLRQVSEEEKLSTLMMAAQQDVRLHQARIKASVRNDVSLLKDYSFQKDQLLQERLARKEARKNQFQKLQQDAKTILHELEDDKKTVLTQTERIQVKLARWQRALELYVYCPTKMDLDLLGLLEKLMDGTSEVRASSAFFFQKSLAMQYCYSHAHHNNNNNKQQQQQQNVGRGIVPSPLASLAHVPSSRRRHVHGHARRDRRRC